MNIIGLIPARSKSKGLKLKNIYPLRDKPLIAHTIATIETSNITDYYCSTDSDGIAKIAEEFDCKVIKRPSKLATDNANMLSVVKHFKDYLISRSIEFDAIQILYPTYPLRTSQLVNDSITEYKKNSEKVLIGLHEVDTHPYLCYKLTNGKIISYLNIDANKYYRRQDYPEMFELCHAICIIPKKEINNINNQLYNENTKGFIIQNKKETINIDTIEDLKYAEFLLREGHKK